MIWWLVLRYTNMSMTPPFLNLCPLFLKWATSIHISSVCFLELSKIPWKLITLIPKKCFWVHFQSSVFLLWSLLTIQSNACAGLNSLEFILVMTCRGICSLTIFVPEQMLACISSNDLSVLVFLLTDLLLGIPPSSDQCLNTAQLFGTTAWGSIKQKRSRRSRGELFALFIQWQRLCHTEWRCSILSFRLFQIGATDLAAIFSANCLIRLIAFICCHPLVTLKSHLDLEKQPHILDPVTDIGLYHYHHHHHHPRISSRRKSWNKTSLVHFFCCIALRLISFLVLFCCTVHFCLFSFLIFSLLPTSLINWIWIWVYQ